MERKRMTSTERDAMQQMAVCCELINAVRVKLQDRTRGIKRARSRLGLAQWALNSLLADYMDTMPTEQLVNLKNNLKMCSFVIGVKSPQSKHRDDKNYGIWVSFDQLNWLIEGCHDHCLMCGFDKTGRKTCPLRKALDMIPNDVPDAPDGDCPYYGVV